MKSKPVPCGWRLLRPDEKPRTGDRFDFFNSKSIRDFAVTTDGAGWPTKTFANIRKEYNGWSLRIVRRLPRKKGARK